MSEWRSRPEESAGVGAPALRKVLPSTLAHSVRWLTVALLAGMVLGPVVALFEQAVGWCEGRLGPLWVFGLPVAGALAVGWLLLHEPRVGGNGTQEYIQTFERGDRLPLRLSPMKWLASALTLGSGGSGGKAGPMILVGASVGSGLSRGLRVDRPGGPDLGALAGAGAALGALLGTPLGGGLMAAEILYAEGIHYRGLFTSVIASCIGATVRRHFSTPHIEQVVHAFRRKPPTVVAGEGWLQLADWLLAAVVAAALSLGFILLYGWVERAFRNGIRRPGLRPAAGAVVCWGVGLVCMLLVPSAVAATRGVFGTGDALLAFAVGGGPLAAIALVLVGKGVATASTVGSGGSGGLVLPALILGALSGSVAEAALKTVMVAVPVELPLVGMAAGLAAVVNVPVAAVVLLVELFGTQVTVPVVVGAMVGFVIGRPWVVYQYSRLGAASREKGTL